LSPGEVSHCVPATCLDTFNGNSGPWCSGGCPIGTWAKADEMQPAARTAGVRPAYSASGWLHPCPLMPRLPWMGLRPNIDGWQETRSVADSAKPRHDAKQLLQTWKVLQADVSTTSPLAPSSDLPVATVLLAFPRLLPPHQGLQAAQACYDVSGEGWRPATTLRSWRHATSLPTSTPCNGPLSLDGAVQGATGTLVEPNDDGGDAGVCRRGS
jgi:hypothetical protein